MALSAEESGPAVANIKRLGRVRPDKQALSEHLVNQIDDQGVERRDPVRPAERRWSPQPLNSSPKCPCCRPGEADSDDSAKISTTRGFESLEAEPMGSDGGLAGAWACFDE